MTMNKTAPNRLASLIAGLVIASTLATHAKATEMIDPDDPGIDHVALKADGLTFLTSERYVCVQGTGAVLDLWTDGTDFWADGMRAPFEANTIIVDLGDSPDMLVTLNTLSGGVYTVYNDQLIIGQLADESEETMAPNPIGYTLVRVPDDPQEAPSQPTLTIKSGSCGESDPLLPKK